MYVLNVTSSTLETIVTMIILSNYLLFSVLPAIFVCMDWRCLRKHWNQIKHWNSFIFIPPPYRKIKHHFRLIYFPLHTASVNTLFKICNSLKMDCIITDEGAKILGSFLQTKTTLLNITLTDNVITSKRAILLINASNIKRILTAFNLLEKNYRHQDKI